MIEVYWGSGSALAWRVLLAFAIKGVPHTSKLLSFAKGEHKTKAFLAMNPRGQVPAVRDGDFVLSESLAILAWLDKKHPEPPLFGETAEEAGYVWRAVMEHELQGWPALRKVFQPILANTFEGNEAELMAAVPEMHAELARYEAELASNEWLTGPRVSAADVVVFPTLMVLLRAVSKPEGPPDLGVEPLEAKYPKLAAWKARIEALPGYEATYPPHWRIPVL